MKYLIYMNNELVASTHSKLIDVIEIVKAISELHNHTYKVTYKAVNDE